MSLDRAFAALAILIAGSAAAAERRVEHTRLINPDVLSVEALGKAQMFTLQMDHMISEDVGVGAGFGSVRLNDQLGNEAGRHANLIPIYAHYYFTRDAGSFFAEGGLNFVTNWGDSSGLASVAGNVGYNGTLFQPTLGFGFEARLDNGVMYRPAVYAIVSNAVSPWFGFSVGYAY